MQKDRLAEENIADVVKASSMQADTQQPAPAKPPAHTATADKPASQLQFPPPKAPSSLPAGTKRKLAEASLQPASKRRITPESTHVQPASAGAATAAASATAQQQASSRQAGEAGASSSSIVFQQQASLHVELGREALPLADQPEPGLRVLEAVQQGTRWQLVCHSGGQKQWSDEVQGKVNAVGGSMHFSAAGFQSGAIQVCRLCEQAWLWCLTL